MTKKQEQHLARIKKSFLKEVNLKYRKGQKEHGGNLIDNPNLIDEVMNEAIDLYVYLHTLREQLK